VNNVSFSGIDLRVKGLFEQNKRKKLLAVNPDNINLNIITNHSLTKKVFSGHKDFQNFNESFSISKRYIQLFDCYGEMSLKNDFYLK
jgi:hypothetical protein